MPYEQIRYIIFVQQKGGEDVMFAAPVGDDDRFYFENGILPTLRCLSNEDYVNGHAAVLHSAARFSYILADREVFWCAEWEPGLIVVRVSAEGQMAWTALRSPIPNFGGRTPSEDDCDFDEDAVNHQYNLVFRAWDAQFDEQCRKWRSFERADQNTADAFSGAIRHLNSLEDQIRKQYSEETSMSSWWERCKRNLAKWSGDGIRVAL